MHHQHVEMGAVMVDSDGWQLPARYTSATEEVERLRTGVGISDVSPAGKLSLQGDDIDRVVTGAFPDLRRLEIGTVALADRSKVLARLAHDEYMVITGPNLASNAREALGDLDDQCAHLVDVTSAFAGVRIAGPSGRMFLQAVTDVDISQEALSDMSCVQTSVAGIYGLLLRIDLADVLSYDLYFARDHGEYMWKALLEAGAGYRVTPFGVEAMDLLTSEA